MFKAKKKMASVVGDSKAGRTAVIKILGKEGALFISTLKAAVTEWRDKKTAKAVKHDAMKLVLKASMLWNHKDLTADNTNHLRRPVQIIAETLLDVCDRRVPGERRPDQLVSDLAEVRGMLKELLSPHMKEKNAAMVDTVMDVYGDAGFLTHFMNEASQKENLEGFTGALSRFMAPFPKVLDDDQSLRASLEKASRALDLQNPTLDTFLNESTLTNMLQEFLEKHDGGAHKHALLFLHAEKDFRSITNRKILPSRASNVLAKYIASSASKKIKVDPQVAKSVEETVEGGRANRNVFEPVVKDLRKRLGDAFDEAFLNSEACKAKRAEAAKELADLKQRYGEKWSSVDKAKAQRVMSS